MTLRNWYFNTREKKHEKKYQIHMKNRPIGQYITKKVKSRFAELITVILKMQMQKFKDASKDTSVEICKDYTY